MDCRRLFLARGIRLPRRHMGSRRRIRPDQLRHPRGLRGAAEAQEPCEEIGAVLLKHRQDGFWGEGNLCVHGVTLSVRLLTDGSGETASTPKIVSDVAARGSRGRSILSLRPAKCGQQGLAPGSNFCDLVCSNIRLASTSVQTKKKSRSIDR